MVKGLSISSYSNESAARFLIGQTKGKLVNIVGLVPKPGQSLLDYYLRDFVLKRKIPTYTESVFLISHQPLLQYISLLVREDIAALSPEH